MKENSKQHGEIGKGYWMARRLPNGEWRKLTPYNNTDILWSDSSSNSYITPGTVPGKWEISIDDSSYRGTILANSYERFSDGKAEGYYVFE